MNLFQTRPKTYKNDEGLKVDRPKKDGIWIPKIKSWMYES